MRFSRHATYLIAVGALLVAVAAPRGASASTLVQLDLASLVANADQVVRGEVDGIESHRRDGRLYTDVRLRVTERWKGEGDGTVTVRLPGGRDGEMVTKVHGVPYFGHDERVVLFLSARSQDATFVPTGLGQGKFVVRPPEGDESGPMAVPQVGDVRMVAPTDDDQTRTRRPRETRLDPSEFEKADPAPVHRAPLPLAELRSRVHDLLEGEDGG